MKMMLTTHRRYPSVILFLCLGGLTLAAEAKPSALRLPKIFSDHMVLQREAPIPVFGWAKAGAAVSVTLENDTVTTTANNKGRWIAHLPARQAGGPYKLVVKSGKRRKTFKDILVGEVWLCSGQSNMTLPLNETANGKDVAAAANNSNFRYFHIGYNMGHIANQPLKDLQGDNGCTYGWEPVSPKMAGAMSAIAYYFGNALQKKLTVPVGIIHASWGGVGIASYTPRAGCAADPQFSEAMKNWDKDWADFRTSKDPAKNPNRHDNFNNAIQQPAGLYNGSIAPVCPFGLRGVVWYQGESDAGNPAPYQKRLTRMIRLWRKAWGNKTMPFLIVQLPGFYAPTEGPADGGWAQAREAQKLAAKATNSHLVVIIDLGDAENIHPLNKKDVGKRLARTAEAKIYGCKNVAFSGPVFQSARRKGKSLVVTFTHAKGLRTSDGGPVKGFVVAGRDGQYEKADARIDGDRVIVSSPKVRQPVKVRYAWADNPICNLINKAKLPAQPFQADVK